MGDYARVDGTDFMLVNRESKIRQNGGKRRAG